MFFSVICFLIYVLPRLLYSFHYAYGLTIIVTVIS
uniref:Uncharacterized protein n=1 Tax=Rhizophora mucronata TaxID=61149 RepID=A0A2P2NI22_RHIMU